MPNNYVNKYADFINGHHKGDYWKLSSVVARAKDIKSKKDTPPEDIKSKKDKPPYIEDMEGGPYGKVKPKLTKADISQMMSALFDDNMHHPDARKTPTVKRNKSDLK